MFQMFMNFIYRVRKSCITSSIHTHMAQPHSGDSLLCTFLIETSCQYLAALAALKHGIAHQSDLKCFM